MKYLSSIYFSSLVAVCSTFTAPITTFVHSRSSAKRPSILMAKNADDDTNNYEDDLSQRTDINHFLTQRTFQTFIHLLKQFRDPHTGNWIEDFIGSQNLLHYHGTGAISLDKYPKWDCAFKEMIDKDPEVIIIEIQATNAGRGLSKNNPYREKEVSLVHIIGTFSRLAKLLPTLRHHDASRCYSHCLKFCSLFYYFFSFFHRCYLASESSS